MLSITSRIKISVISDTLPCLIETRHLLFMLRILSIVFPFKYITFLFWTYNVI